MNFEVFTLFFLLLAFFETGYSNGVMWHYFGHNNRHKHKDYHGNIDSKPVGVLLDSDFLAVLRATGVTYFHIGKKNSLRSEDRVGEIKLMILKFQILNSKEILTQ